MRGWPGVASLCVGLGLGLVSAGCGPPFDPISFVNSLRVLGIKADPPEVAPGETSQLTTLLGPIGLDGGQPDLQWAICLRAPPPGGGSINDDCAKNETADYLTPIGSGETVSVTMPNVPPLSLGLPDATLGVYLPVRLIARSGDQKVISFYRLRYAIGTPPNHNPVIDGMFIASGDADGGIGEDAGANALVLVGLDEHAPFEVHALDKLRIRATVAPGSDETFPEIDGDPRNMMFTQVTELPRFAWYITAGELSEDITGEDKPDTVLDFEKHLPSSETTIDLYVVVNDDRGGTDWRHRTLIFR